jgi:hypothetical protein
LALPLKLQQIGERSGLIFGLISNELTSGLEEQEEVKIWKVMLLFPVQELSHFSLTNSRRIRLKDTSQYQIRIVMWPLMFS